MNKNKLSKLLRSLFGSTTARPHRPQKHQLGLTLAPLEAREVPAAFVVETVKSNLGALLAVRFGDDGKVWTAEKGGTVSVYENLTDPTATVVLDLKKNVHNYWDRGLVGMAVHPNFATNPYVYVLYTYDGNVNGPSPKYGTAEYDSDPYPDPPIGELVSGRLSRFRINPDMTAGAEEVLIHDWPQQFQSHSVGSVMFGPDGALYVSSGDGASFTSIDYGQFGNPANDPMNEGGALRSQDILSNGDPLGLNGTILRVDPETGAGLADNPFGSDPDPNKRRIIANGTRNPFRFDFRPGTQELWFGDVGWDNFEEINRITNIGDPISENFGWPAYEGPGRQASYDAADLPLLESLYANPNLVTAPYFAYAHNEKVVPGSVEDAGGSSISGVAFYDGNTFPAEYQNALIFSDYSRQSIYIMKTGANGLPDPTKVELLLPGEVGAAIDVQVGPDGDLYFINVFAGDFRRISFTDGNTNPIPVLTSNVSSGNAPLQVQFDGRQSYDLDTGDTISYAWDLDGDGAFDDSVSGNPTFTYNTPGNYAVKLRVTDSQGASSVATKTISVSTSNTFAAFIDTPTMLDGHAIGDTITFSGRATDANGAPLPVSALRWTIDIMHADVDNPSNVHVHRLSQQTGVASGSFVFPDHEYPSYVELTLTATNNGETTSKKVRIDAATFSVLMVSNIPGVTLSIDNATKPAPFTQTVFKNSLHTISAPATQTIGGQTYQFVGWANGGAASQTATINGNRAFTANYQLVTTGTPTVNFGNGFGTGTGTLQFNGGAAVVGTALRITEKNPNQQRSVFTKDKVAIGKFDTTFDLIQNNAVGDGLTFVLQGQAPTALGYGGGGLAYGGITPSVAVKFDIYDNGGEGTSSTGLYTNGAEPGPTGSVSLAGSGIDLRNGNPKRVTLSYDGTTLTQTIRDLQTNAVFTRNYTINLTQILGDTAYVGFTGSTGGVSAEQEIATWTYTANVDNTPRPPVAPTNTKVIVPGYSGLATATIPVSTRITWDVTPTATGYRVERKLVGASTYSLLAAINSGATTTYTDNAAQAGRSYYYRVLAFNANGNGLYAPVLRANVPAVPAAPTNLQAYVRSPNSIRITWTDNANNESGYQIFRSVGSGPMTLLTHIPASATNYTDYDLAANTAYTYRVQAFTTSGASGFVQATTTLPAGATPTVNFSGGFANSTGVTLNGSSTITGNRLQLTKNQNTQVGSAFTTAKVNISSFTTTFDLRLTDAIGDGMAFVIQGNAPTAQGYGGGGLGAGGIANSVIIKFDLFDNGGEGTSSTGVYTNGAEPGAAGSVNLLTSGINLRDGNPKRVTLAYNGVTLTQTIRDLVTGAFFTRKYTLNITNLIGATTAHVGFTGSTGGVNAQQEVANWTYIG